ncbi:hypothetical protein PIB30_054164 [Stylosanthes scabra]|uniref:DUF4283 domain-containing protein n=1 Tax=Stylosanthes scabra TaxID=79078 RepID=A0ABU6TIH8_9FABA|nr:hypothetical protein [Stylosanthes scabra]
MKVNNMRHGSNNQLGSKQGMIQKWVEVRKTRIGEEQSKETRTMVGTAQRKKVDGTWVEDQKQRLQKSLLGFCVKQIEFRKVMNRWLDECKGPGEIECRDVGPYKCLITFESPEIRNDAFQNELLLEIFDEVRPHWELLWSLSQHVRIELMGMPMSVWSVGNFSKIAKMWGKVVMFDDRIEESKSFTVARVLVDCYQWERIHEWVNVRVKDRMFEKLILGRGWKKLEGCGTGASRSGFDTDREIGGDEWGISVMESMEKLHGSCYIRSVRMSLLDFDLRVRSQRRTPLAHTHRASAPVQVVSMCTVNLDRAKQNPNLEDGCSAIEGVGDETPLNGYELVVVGDKEHGRENSGEEEVSDETLYKINEEAFRSLLDVDGGAESWVANGFELVRNKEDIFCEELNVGELYAKDATGGGVREAVLCSGEGACARVCVATRNEQSVPGVLMWGVTSDEDNSVEVVAVKEVWGKGAFHLIAVTRRK